MKLPKGTKFVVSEEVTVMGQTYWHGAYTGGFRCTVPKGTIVLSLKEIRPVTLGFICIPENREHFEKRFVPEKDRNSPKYAGYSLFFWRWHLKRKVRLLDS